MSLTLHRRGRIWYIRGSVRGRRCYKTTGTSDRKLAEIGRAKEEAALYEIAVFGNRASASFLRAASDYLDFEDRSEATRFYVFRLIDHFGSTSCTAIDQEAADAAVAAIVGNDAAPTTKRRGVYGPLSAILNHAAAKGWCAHPHFRQPRPSRPETPWLSPIEARALIDSAAPHLRPLVRFILCTGARLGEALDLDWRDIRLDEHRAIFRDVKTRAGHEKNRRAALPPGAIEALLATANRTGAVFRRDDGRSYENRGRCGGGQIRTSWKTACRAAGLIVWETNGASCWKPALTPHGLRHTWATWFYALTKDPYLLRDEGGWESSRMVERYAHLMPTGLAPGISEIWGPSHPRIGIISPSEYGPGRDDDFKRHAGSVAGGRDG